jgi:glyoxylase-like metal-dependent hydrolase (beta-lactamase superfamily II)
MRIHALSVGPLQACCYLVAPDKGPEAAVIDPGGDADLIVEQLRYRKLTPILVLLTHGHIDHIEAVAALKRAFPEAQVCIHERDAEMLGDAGAALASWIGLSLEPCEPDRLLADGDTLALGPHTLEVIHTPGHTRGGVAYLIRQDGEPAILFSGDTLFAGGIGRTDFPGGNYSQLLDSIRERLFALPDETLVYPGHGEPSTIGEERRTNPFLR